MCPALPVRPVVITNEDASSAIITNAHNWNSRIFTVLFLFLLTFVCFGVISGAKLVQINWTSDEITDFFRFFRFKTALIVWFPFRKVFRNFSFLHTSFPRFLTRSAYFISGDSAKIVTFAPAFTIELSEYFNFKQIILLIFNSNI